MSEPKRWLEDEALGGPLRELLDGAAQLETSDAAMERLGARLSPTFAQPPPSPTAPATLAPKLLGALLIGLVAAGLWLVTGPSTPALLPKVPAEKRAPARVAEPPPAPTLPIERFSSPSAPASPEEAAPTPPSRRPARTTRRSPPRTSPPPDDSFAAEVALLGRTQAALAVDPGGALALCRQHAREFPSGVLVEEREVYAIDALSRLGRGDAARQRAFAFHQRFPGSGYGARVSASLRRVADAAPSDATPSDAAPSDSNPSDSTP